MKEPGQPLFLARQTYRERRLMDVARLLPILGILLLLLPLFWAGPAHEGTATSRGVIYLFSVWIGLIAIAAILSRRLERLAQSGNGDEDSPP